MIKPWRYFGKSNHTFIYCLRTESNQTTTKPYIKNRNQRTNNAWFGLDLCPMYEKFSSLFLFHFLLNTVLRFHDFRFRSVIGRGRSKGLESVTIGLGVLFLEDFKMLQWIDLEVVFVSGGFRNYDGISSLGASLENVWGLDFVLAADCLLTHVLIVYFFEFDYKRSLNNNKL